VISLFAVQLIFNSCLQEKDMSALDQETETFLASMAAQNAPRLCDLPVAEARQALSQLTSAGLIETPALAAVEDRLITGRNGDIHIRIYRSLNDGGSLLPVILFFHGGGFVLGDCDSHDTITRYMAGKVSALVISVDYRLAPEHKFPAGLNDCYDTLLWASGHAATLGGDARRIAVVGDSAGGNLSAALCLKARDEKGPAICYQVLAYPCMIMEGSSNFASRRSFAEGYFLTHDDIKWLAGLYTNSPADSTNPLVSPLLAKNLSGLPPALVITAGFDPLRDEGIAYAGRLAEAGVETTYRCFETTIHGFLSFAAIISAGREGLAFIAQSLSRAFTSES
jgi:acetyl esterase